MNRMHKHHAIGAIGLMTAASCTLTSTALAQSVGPDVRREIQDAIGFDLFDGFAEPATNDVPYQLRREDLVRLDNPAVKVDLDRDRIVTPPPLIDKRDFRVLQSNDYLPEVINVRFKPGVDAARAQRAHDAMGASLQWTSPLVPGLCQVRLPGDLDMSASVNAYLDMDDVLYAEPEYRVSPATGVFDPPDPLQGDQWGLRGGTVSWNYWGSQACNAWYEYTGGTVVAIIDSGTETFHPDLADNIWVNAGEIPGNGIDDDGNGYTDDVNGWNVADCNGDVDPCGNDHGTHVAGTVSARGGNEIGGVGVSPFGKLMILRCNGELVTCGFQRQDPCSGLWLTYRALSYAIANGARISNNSYGSLDFSESMYDTILAGQAAGHLFVAAAGNGNSDGVGDDNDVIPYYPASYDLPNIISVAAIETDGELAPFSNYGVTSVDIGAPGTSILSTGLNGGYVTKQGTSMASPHVAGAASLIMGRYPALSWQQVKQRILDSRNPNIHLIGLTVAGGQVNAQAALGVWVEPAWMGTQEGWKLRPWSASSIDTAYAHTPPHGTLNFKAGTVPASELGFVWDKPMTLQLREGSSVILGD